MNQWLFERSMRWSLVTVNISDPVIKEKIICAGENQLTYNMSSQFLLDYNAYVNQLKQKGIIYLLPQAAVLSILAGVNLLLASKIAANTPIKEAPLKDANYVYLMPNTMLGNYVSTVPADQNKLLSNAANVLYGVFPNVDIKNHYYCLSFCEGYFVMKFIKK